MSDKKQDCEQIQAWSKKIVEKSETKISTANENDAQMVVPKDVAFEAFKESGYDHEAVAGFGKTIANFARAMHHAATEKNIERIKEAVKEGKDYRELRTIAVAKVTPDLGFVGSSKAERSGEIVRADKTKTPYRKHNFGMVQVDINAGIPTELKEKQLEELKEVIKESKFYVPDEQATAKK